MALHRALSAVILLACLVFAMFPGAPTAARDDLRDDCLSGFDGITACTALIRQNPRDAEAYHARGKIYLRSVVPRRELALNDLNKAIELDPNRAAYYLTRATIYFGNKFGGYVASGYLENRDRTLSDATRAISLDPGNAEAYAVRCEANILLLDRQRAMSDCKQALDLDPKKAAANLAALTRSVPDADALAGPQQPVACAFENDPNNPRLTITNNLGRELPADIVVRVAIRFKDPSKRSAPGRVMARTVSHRAKPGEKLALWMLNDLPTPLAGCTAVAIMRSDKSIAAFMAALMKPNPLGEISFGNENAPVTIIQYMNLNRSVGLGHAGFSFLKNRFPWLSANYIDVGKVRYILRERPFSLVDIAGFLVVRCASRGDRTAYVSLAMKLILDMDRWPRGKITEPLKAFAAGVGLNEQAFTACLSDKATYDQMAAIKRQADEKLNLDNSGEFFINGERYSGLNPAFVSPETDQLKALVDGYLERDHDSTLASRPAGKPSVPATGKSPEPAAQQGDSDGARCRTSAPAPDCWTYFYERAGEEAEQYDYADAAADYESAARLDPDNSGVLLALACRNRAAAGHLDEALRDCAVPLAAFSKNYDAREARGLVFLKMGDFDKAIVDFDMVVAVKGVSNSSAFALYGRGLAKLRKGDSADGSTDIAKANSLKLGLANEFTRVGVDIGPAIAANPADCASQALTLFPGCSPVYCTTAVLPRVREALRQIEDRLVELQTRLAAADASLQNYLRVCRTKDANDIVYWDLDKNRHRLSDFYARLQKPEEEVLFSSTRDDMMREYRQPACMKEMSTQRVDMLNAAAALLGKLRAQASRPDCTQAGKRR